MQIIRSPKAPQPVGPYSQAVRAGDWLFVSGQLGIDPETSRLVEGGIEAETRRALGNLKAILETAGASCTQVVKTTVFVLDLAELKAMNAVYREVFGEHAPARAAIQAAALPLGGRVEIEAVVYLGGK